MHIHCGLNPWHKEGAQRFLGLLSLWCQGSREAADTAGSSQGLPSMGLAVVPSCPFPHPLCYSQPLLSATRCSATALFILFAWRPARVLSEYMLQRFAECMTRSIRGMIKWGKCVPLTAGWRGGGLTVLSLVPEAPRLFYEGQKEREEWFWKNGSRRCQMLILPRPRDVSKLGSTPEWGGPRSRGPWGDSHALRKVRGTFSFPRTLASAWR